MVFDDAGERVAAAREALKARATRDLAETILSVCSLSELLSRSIIEITVALLCLRGI